jgi:hypothetical protein
MPVVHRDYGPDRLTCYLPTVCQGHHADFKKNVRVTIATSRVDALTDQRLPQRLW